MPGKKSPKGLKKTKSLKHVMPLTKSNKLS
jgi:hypothetical protein